MVSSVSPPLRILVLGGTGHIGPYFVRAAVSRGHKVTTFDRGKRSLHLPVEVERLVGNRSSNLDSIKNRDWDAVFDLATYVPSWVQTLGQELKDRVGHYTLISTVAVYEHPASNQKLSEASPVLSYASAEDPYLLPYPRNVHEYGSLKVLCEGEAQRQFPNCALVLRPGYIVGPDDPQGYFTYLPVRMEKGGEVLIAGDPIMPVQFIDVRDLAEWAIRLAEMRVTGIYNAVGPAAPTSFGQLISAACNVTLKSPKVTWVATEWLAATEDRCMWDKLLYWSFESEGWAWAMNMDVEQAIANGLTLRPMNATLAATCDWYRRLPEEQQASLLSRKKPREDSAGFDREIIPWRAYLEREQEILNSWHVHMNQVGQASSQACTLRPV